MIFYKDWSGTSPNQTEPPTLVGSIHQHQPGRASLVLPPRLDRSDYSEPWSGPVRCFWQPPCRTKQGPRTVGNTCDNHEGLREGPGSYRLLPSMGGATRVEKALLPITTCQSQPEHKTRAVRCHRGEGTSVFALEFGIWPEELEKNRQAFEEQAVAKVLR